MTVHYAVPSHARAEKVNGWALRALADAGVPADQVTVFVAPAQACGSPDEELAKTVAALEAS